MVKLDGNSLKIEDVLAVSRNNDSVEVDSAAWERIAKCRAMCEEKIQACEIMYGVNTGIGEFSEVVLTQDQVKTYQKFLVYSHAPVWGDPCPSRWCAAPCAAESTSTATANRALGPWWLSAWLNSSTRA
jgi:histidine ammonia-lyase